MEPLVRIGRRKILKRNWLKRPKRIVLISRRSLPKMSTTELTLTRDDGGVRY